MKFGRHTNPLDASHHHAIPELRKRPRVMHWLRVVAAALVVVAVIGVGGLLTLYFFVQGEARDGSALHGQVVSGLEQLVGDGFKVSLGKTDLSLDWSGSLAIASSDIAITRRDNEAEVARVNRARVRLKLLPLLKGQASFSRVQIDEISADMDKLGAQNTHLLSPFLDRTVAALGQELNALNTRMHAGDLGQIEVRNSRISGTILGRLAKDPIELEWLRVDARDQGFELNARMSTVNSEASLTSAYQVRSDQSRDFVFGVEGLNLAEWLSNPDEEKGMIGADGLISVKGSFPYDFENRPQDPKLTILAGNNRLRVGRKEQAAIHSGELNFRLMLDKNQIELDPSRVNVGGLEAEMVGGLKPVDPDKGYAGAILYDIIMNQGRFMPTVAGEESIPAAFKATGTYDRVARVLSFSDAFLTTRAGAIRGSGEFGLTDASPSITATAETEGISVTAVKQFWPMFITPGARAWVHDHVLDGWIESGSLQARIPPGIIFKLRDGAQLTPEQFTLEAEVRGFKFLPLGDLPPIGEGKGGFGITGMKFSAHMDEGSVSEGVNGVAKIDSGHFEMANFAENPRRGETRISFSGDLKTIGEIGDAAPLRILGRMKVDPEQFNGKAHVDLIARFPITRTAKYADVDWNLLVDMQGASSKRKLAGRMITEADLLVDATPTGASVSGTAKVDGVMARLSLSEPIGKSGQTERRRKITAVLGAEERESLGIRLSPVVEGPIKATILQTSNSETHEIDFSDAEVALPWVGWRKGKGIPAKATFKLKRKGEINRLEDFHLAGQGFGAKGLLAFDKKGLLQADISQIVLNDNDSVAVKVERKDDIFNITATGESYDARGLVNSLIHEASFTSAQGSRSVRMNANIGNVTGFQDRSLQNVQLIYHSDEGWVSKIDLKATSNNGASYSVIADRQGEATVFRFLSNDAGHGLAFSNIYTYMAGGELKAELKRIKDGPFTGPVQIRNFEVINEPRLAKLASTTKRNLQQLQDDRFQFEPITGDRKVRFSHAEAAIEKGSGYLNVDDGAVRSLQFGMTFNGTVFDNRDRMNLRGTFMPAMALNLAVSAIPLIGELFSNGTDNALIGITYRLDGPRTQPNLLINPMSAVTPGVFNRVFEFQK